MKGDAPIAAIATASGPGAIAIVRLSGDGVLDIADRFCPSSAYRPSSMPGGAFRLFRLHDPGDGTIIDEALVLVFRAPKSYTGDDTVEFQIHGGGAAARRLLNALFLVGVRPAEPGEFSKRAFLNGRLPLDRAEAVMDLVGARTEKAARAAAEQLCGAVGRAVNEVWDALVALCADVEATLDFTDEEAEGLVPVADFERRANGLSSRLLELAGTVREGRILREGALVALSGPPNAGKSTLFNALLGTERAIVNEEPGTTRDSLEETIVIDGFAIRLVDTAGLRENAPSAVEREGVVRARAVVETADLVLDCMEAGEKASSPLAPPAQSQKRLHVFTKSDLHQAFLPPEGAIAVSARTGYGMDELRGAIVRLILGGAPSSPEVAVSDRHAALLREAAHAVEDASAMWRKDAEDAAVPVASRLRAAADALGRITGRTFGDDVLDAVFGRFCIGK